MNVDAGGAAQRGSACCAPSHRLDVPVPGRRQVDVPAAWGRSQDHTGFVRLEAADFLIGTDSPEAFPGDREGPVRRAHVAGFAIAQTTVTNNAFTEFVAATDYRTDAEMYGWSFVFHLLLHEGARPHVMDAVVPGAPWWLGVEGARWDRPDGPGSDLNGRGDHPVVHVSYVDALAYCRWSGTRLPTETEWEYAARGGLIQANFPWGDDLTPGGEHWCNIWQGDFPTTNTAADGWVGTAPARSFPPNGFDLYNLAGNVWEMCASSWRAGGPHDGGIVIRGGSYLCHASYCNRYRVAARSRTSRDSSTGNTGFRICAA